MKMFSIEQIFELQQHIYKIVCLLAETSNNFKVLWVFLIVLQFCFKIF